jgi:hypothetical protein
MGQNCSSDIYVAFWLSQNAIAGGHQAAGAECLLLWVVVSSAQAAVS